MCRFEKSLEPLCGGIDTVVLRIVKVTTPITCSIPGYDNHLPIPQEGALVMHRGAGRFLSGLKTWRLSLPMAKRQVVQDLLREI